MINMHKYNQSAAEQYYGSFGHCGFGQIAFLLQIYFYACPCPFGLRTYTSNRHLLPAPRHNKK